MYGRLGLGNHVGPKDPTRPELCPQCKKIESQSRGLCVLPTEIKKLRGVQIKSLVCGPAHNMFVTKKSGRLFVWGKCHEGQAGVGRRKGPSLDSCIDFPIEIPFFLKNKIRVEKVSTSVEHVLITASNQVYSWGSGVYGKLGHGDEKRCSKPKRIEYFSKEEHRIVSIGAARQSSVVVLRSKKSEGVQFYMFGQDQNTPKHTSRVPTPLNVGFSLDSDVELSCGYFHTIATTPRGLIFGFGANDHFESKTQKPHLVLDRKVRKVTCGDGWSAILLEDGRVATCGINEYGQLGSGDRSNRDRFQPVCVEGTTLLQGSVIEIACGRKHLVVVGLDRERKERAIYTCGLNDIGQLSVRRHASSICLLSPVLLRAGSIAGTDDARIVVVGGTNHTIVAVLEDEKEEDIESHSSVSSTREKDNDGGGVL